jgi:hypothetical protein
MKTKRHRWNCPECNDGILLGPRPNQFATDRFCLPCSSKGSRLVERVCATLEAKRHGKVIQARSKARAESDAKREVREEEYKAAQALKDAHEALYIFNGLDLRKEMKRLVRIAKSPAHYPNAEMPSLDMAHDSKGTYVTGYVGRVGYGTERHPQIAMTLFPGVKKQEALGMLCHLVALSVVPKHGSSWRFLYRHLAESGYNVVVGKPSDGAAPALDKAVQYALASA